MGVPTTNSAAVAGMPHDGDDADLLARATWTAAFIDTLPDSSFAVVSDGGVKKDGITHPLTLRHLPYKDADGKIDLPHLRNALARLPQSALSAADKATAEKALQAAAKEAGVGDENQDERAAAAPFAGAELAGTLYAPFVRRDDAKWEVEGVLTSEDVDTYGTSFDYDSAKRAVAEWAGNVREQHDEKKAVGRRVEYECDDANRLVTLRVRVSKGAPDTWAKVQDGTLSGFSIGAYNARRETRTINGRPIPVYKDYSYGEVSLVDAPSNPAAAKSGLTICRAAGFTASGQTEWNDAVLDTFDAPVATPATPAAAAETPAAETVVAPAEAPETPITRAAETVATPETPSLADLESAVGPVSEEMRASIIRAAALITGSAPAAVAATATPTVAAVATPDPALTRDGIDLATGAAFQGNDLASGASNASAGADGARAANHNPFTGTHAHSHPAFGSQGDDETHAHEHSHDGDADHGHAHGERVVAADADLERAAKGDKPKVSAADQKVNAAITEVAAALNALKAAQASDEASEGKTVSPGDKSVDTAISAAFAALEKIRTAQESDIAADPDDGADSERAAAGGDVTAVLTPEAETERAGQRISAATSSALHQSALGILLVCGCPTCQDAASLLNPDDEDDDSDAGDMSDTPDASDAGANGRAVAASLTRAARMQRVQLTRATRKAVAAEVARELAPMSGLIQQMRGIAARLTSVPTVPTVQSANGSDESQSGEHASVTSQLDEFRASVETQMRAVQGLVEQIAAQPAPGGPILRAVGKTLGQYDPAHVLDASTAPQAPVTPGDLSPEQLAAAVRQLQRSGALSDQGSQVNAAAAILQQQMRGR